MRVGGEGKRGQKTTMSDFVENFPLIQLFFFTSYQNSKYFSRYSLEIWYASWGLIKKTFGFKNLRVGDT